jgi:NADPH2:quinone reductase
VRAWQVTGIGQPAEVLELCEQADSPGVGPGFVRIRVSAAGVGLPDLLMCRDAYALTPPPPFTPGQEAVGIVTEAGSDSHCEVGDRVMGVTGFFVGRGGFAEECLLLDDFALPVPRGMGDAEAAGFTISFHTAYVGLVRRARLSPGESLLVLGAAGGTGHAAVQMGKALGARVIAVAGGAEKTAFCRALGADEVIDHRSEDVATRTRELTDSRGADVIWDPVGGEAFDAATRCIASEGRLLLIGFASGRWGTPRAEHMAIHNYAVIGVIPSSYDRAFRLDAQARLADLRAQGKIRGVVHQAFAFEDLQSALAILAGGGATGKLVLRGPDADA